MLVLFTQFYNAGVLISLTKLSFFIISICQTAVDANDICISMCLTVCVWIIDKCLRHVDVCIISRDAKRNFKSRNLLNTFLTRRLLDNQDGRSMVFF